MQNLVKIQEDLKGMPMQALMMYANGQNPSVPPYVALAELNRRKQLGEGAAQQQAMAQGEQPTVKDAVEQSAMGLMQRQQAMQKAQQGALQTGAQVAGVAGMGGQQAMGGIASVPGGGGMPQAKFAKGGIVGYNGTEGSVVKEGEEPDDRDPSDYTPGAKLLRMLGWKSQYPLEERGYRTQAELDALRKPTKDTQEPAQNPEHAVPAPTPTPPTTKPQTGIATPPADRQRTSTSAKVSGAGRSGIGSLVGQAGVDYMNKQVQGADPDAVSEADVREKYVGKPEYLDEALKQAEASRKRKMSDIDRRDSTLATLADFFTANPGYVGPITSNLAMSTRTMRDAADARAKERIGAEDEFAKQMIEVGKDRYGIKSGMFDKGQESALKKLELRGKAAEGLGALARQDLAGKYSLQAQQIASKARETGDPRMLMMYAENLRKRRDDISDALTKGLIVDERQKMQLERERDEVGETLRGLDSVITGKFGMPLSSGGSNVPGKVVAVR